jgi:hypothetical protein
MLVTILSIWPPAANRTTTSTIVASTTISADATKRRCAERLVSSRPNFAPLTPTRVRPGVEKRHASGATEQSLGTHNARRAPE